VFEVLLGSSGVQLCIPPANIKAAAARIENFFISINSIRLC